jgi:hypothetical protein
MKGEIEMEIDFSQEHRTLKAREEEFRGKHVLVIGKEIYEIKDEDQGTRLLEEVRKKHPGRVPLLTYVMKEELYILCP